MIRFGQVEIDEAAREVRVAGEVRHLEPQAFEVLWLLVSHRERVVPKRELLDTVWGRQFVSAGLIDLVQRSWGMGSRILADMIVPGIDAVTRSVFARFQRRAATPEVAAGYIRQLYDADASAGLATIDQRCLIMHYRDDPAIPFAGCHQLALGIDDAQLMPLEGPYHTPPHEHVAHIAETVRQFVEGT